MISCRCPADPRYVAEMVFAPNSFCTVKLYCSTYDAFEFLGMPVTPPESAVMLVATGKGGPSASVPSPVGQCNAAFELKGWQVKATGSNGAFGKFNAAAPV